MSLPSVRESSPVRQKHATDKYIAQYNAAVKHMNETRAKRQKKPTKSTSLPPIDDFILFPDDATTKQRKGSSKNDAKACDCHSQPSKSEQKPSLTADSPTADAKPTTPRRKRVPRHGGFRMLTPEDSDDEERTATRREKLRVPPPAPRPPPLDSPEVSDADNEAFWGSSSPSRARTQRKNAA